MDKRIELLEKFKKIENELVDCLKNAGDMLDEKKKATTKVQINEYIKQVEKARKLFDNYESVALEIEKLSGLKNTEIKTSEEIVNLREELKNEEEIVYETKIQADDKPVKVASKKKARKPIREF